MTAVTKCQFSKCLVVSSHPLDQAHSIDDTGRGYGDGFGCTYILNDCFSKLGFVGFSQRAIGCHQRQKNRAKRGCRMFRSITGSAHGPNHPTARPVNREVFSLAWAEPSVYATGASGRRGPKQLTNSSLFSTVSMS